MEGTGKYGLGRKSYLGFKLKKTAFRKWLREKLGGADYHLPAHGHLTL